MKSQNKSVFLSRLKGIDWDFAGSFSESPFSAIHWHPSRYASQVPAALIGLLSERGEVVLDPFCGSGTTLVEAQRLCRSAIGIDVNPVASLVSRAKTLDQPAETVGRWLSQIASDATHALSLSLGRTNGASLGDIPESVQGTKWYSPEVRSHLATLWKLIGDYRGDKRTIATAAFSATLLPVCRETRHWGYVCDNTQPKGHPHRDVLATFCSIVSNLKRAYVQRDIDVRNRLNGAFALVHIDVTCADATRALEALPDQSVDLVVTSPPYFGVSDYIKSQRLTMEWLEYEIEPLRAKEIGARSKRHRRAASAQYVKELGIVAHQLMRIVRRDRYVALMLGESSARESVLPMVTAAFGDQGFGVVVDLERRVSTQRRQTPSVTAERLLVFTAVG